MSNIPTAQVGKTGMHVSVLGFGAAPIAGIYGPILEDQAVETVKCALANGITLFDTAARYGNGLSELLLGQAFETVPRSSFVLATKLGFWAAAESQLSRKIIRDYVLQSIEGSMQRLKIDKLDVVHIHDPGNKENALDQLFPVLADLRSEGVIGAVGTGCASVKMLTEFAREADFDCFLLAGGYNLIDQWAYEELFPTCIERNVSIFGGCVFATGILATGAQPGARYFYREAPPEIMDKVRRMEAVCARYGVPLRAAALQFCLAHPAMTSAVIGAISTEEVLSNIEVLQHPTPADFWRELKAEGLLREELPVPGDAVVAQEQKA